MHAAQQRFYKLICTTYKSCIVYKPFYGCQDNGNAGVYVSLGADCLTKNNEYAPSVDSSDVW